MNESSASERVTRVYLLGSVAFQGIYKAYSARKWVTLVLINGDCQDLTIRTNHKRISYYYVRFMTLVGSSSYKHDTHVCAEYTACRIGLVAIYISLLAVSLM